MQQRRRQDERHRDGSTGSAVSSPRSEPGLDQGRARPDVTDANRQRLGNARRIDEERVPITDSEARASATSATSRTQAVPHRPRPTPVTACAPGHLCQLQDGRRRLAQAQRIVDQALLLRLVAPAHPNQARSCSTRSTRRLPWPTAPTDCPLWASSTSSSRGLAAGHPAIHQQGPRYPRRMVEAHHPLRRWAPRCANWTSARSRRPCRWGRGRYSSSR